MSAPALTLVSSEDGPLGRDKLRYFLYLQGRWRWRPNKVMKAYGFGLVTMGRGGPGINADGDPDPSLADKQHAAQLNDAWDKVRSGQLSPPARTTLVVYPDGSIGRGFQRAMELRKAARVANGVIWTKEQEKRDSWPRAWKWLKRFGDCDPRTIEPEHFLRIDVATGDPKGLVSEIESKVSINERHMVIKVWRALWKRMAGMKYCDLNADPSKNFANTPPKPRDQIWYRAEVYKLVQVAWRNQYYGLAALMAVAWDSQLSPIDNRSLTFDQARSDDVGIYFAVDRAKTGRAAAATLSEWSQAILVAYLSGFGAELFGTAPLFWTRGGRPVSREGATGRWGGDHGGGRHIPARPYTKSSLNQDFRKVRVLAFGKDEERQLQDMRRSGAVEGDAGNGSIEDQANKMANTVDHNKRLRLTYNPVNVPSVRRWDGSRAKGAKLLERRASKSVTAPPLVTLINERRAAKPLK